MLSGHMARTQNEHYAIDVPNTTLDTLQKINRKRKQIADSIPSDTLKKGRICVDHRSDSDELTI